MLRTTTYFWIALAAQLYATASAGSYKNDGADRIYIEESEEYTWFEASQECLNRGMTLIAVDSRAKQQKLSDIINDLQSRFWIGGFKKSSSQFVWIFKGQSFDFTNWDENEPNNKYNNEDCVELLSSDSGISWNDATCTLKLGYICEEITARKENDIEMELLKDTSENNVLDNRNKDLLNFILKSKEIDIKKYIQENMATITKDIKEEINRLQISINKQISQLSRATTEKSVQENVDESVSAYLNKSPILNFVLNLP
ncbi:collectin-11-like [Musca autumnalis]|uniref:collectin-11-like n=1 Tax=Musca autumnalis TaxID=221902 RepID=UPI003CEAC836